MNLPSLTKKPLGPVLPDPKHYAVSLGKLPHSDKTLFQYNPINTERKDYFISKGQNDKGVKVLAIMAGDNEPVIPLLKIRRSALGGPNHNQTITTIELPGGRIEPDQSIEQAAQAEALEEAGVKLPNGIRSLFSRWTATNPAASPVLECWVYGVSTEPKQKYTTQDVLELNGGIDEKPLFVPLSTFLDPKRMAIWMANHTNKNTVFRDDVMTSAFFAAANKDAIHQAVQKAGYSETKAP